MYDNYVVLIENFASVTRTLKFYLHSIRYQIELYLKKQNKMVRTRYNISYGEFARRNQNLILRKTILILRKTRPDTTYVEKIAIAKCLLGKAIELLDRNNERKGRKVRRRLFSDVQPMCKVIVQKLPHPYLSFNFQK